MQVHYSDTSYRAGTVASLRRIVIKVGTRLLTGIDQVSKTSRVEQLVAEIACLRQRGIELILVTSGAIGAGMQVLEVARRPVQLPKLQALAAVGQLRLMFLYQQAARKHDFHCAQVLLCADDVRNRERHLNTASCIDSLLAENVLPIVNENDSVSVEEIKFGDNDRLAALVAMLTRADLTVMLTSVDGLHENHGWATGRRISLVTGFNPEIRAMAKDTEDCNTSVGGMRSKLSAAESLARAGEPTWIADGRDFSVLQRILAGHDVGTLFVPAPDGARMPSRKRFLAFFSEPAGEVIIDPGAVRALCAKHGSSLLAKGVSACSGVFSRGDTVRVLDQGGREIGRGVSNYSNLELALIKSRHSREIGQVLGLRGYDCVIHRNYLVLTRG